MQSLDVSVPKLTKTVAHGVCSWTKTRLGWVGGKEDGLEYVEELPKRSGGGVGSSGCIFVVSHWLSGCDGPGGDVVQEGEEFVLEGFREVMPDVASEGWGRWFVCVKPVEG